MGQATEGPNMNSSNVPHNNADIRQLNEYNGNFDPHGPLSGRPEAARDIRVENFAQLWLTSFA